MGTGLTPLDTRSNCISNSCDPGFTCPRTVDQCAPDPVVPNTPQPYTCRAIFGFAQFPVDCVHAGGKGDPHITGFDGTKFDFQGVPERTYAIFGRVGGDLLVTRMRASGFKIHRARTLKTYFNEFGLTTAGPKVRVMLVPRGRWWTSRVLVDDKPITRNFNNKHVRISLLKRGAAVHVSTLETKYRFTVGSAKAHARHLNVDFELLKKPSVEHKYVGVVGMTLNRAIGHKVHPGLDVSTDLKTLLRKSRKGSGIKNIKWTKKREMTMRRFFEVDDLFPPNHKNVVTLGGVVARMLVSPKFISEAVPIQITASISE